MALLSTLLASFAGRFRSAILAWTLAVVLPWIVLRTIYGDADGWEGFILILFYPIGAIASLGTVAIVRSGRKHYD